MASAPRWKLSEEQDPNDPGELAKAVANVKLEVPPKLEPGERAPPQKLYPATHGVQMKDEANEQIGYERFNLHTPPDITENTRIVAVLGITQETATPRDDGWFLSDFLAFWHLFNGTTENQRWLHCLNLQELVKQHEVYLHGSPFKERKVVLNADLLKAIESAKHKMEVCDSHKVWQDFKDILFEECTAASKTGENVLILIFAHGDENNQGICLGKGTNMWHIKTFLKAMKPIEPKPKVTMLTANCYGGGWSCHPDVNISTIAAAGKKERSRAWMTTGSTGRNCGVTSAYAESTRALYHALLRDVDRRGQQHDLTSGAQDDAWAVCWNERTGIALSKYEQRWHALPLWPADATLHPGDPYNKDPYVTDEQRADFKKIKKEVKYDVHRGKEFKGGVKAEASSKKRKFGSRYGGTIKGLASIVSNLAASYLHSYKGFDDASDDLGLHNLLHRIIAGKEPDYDQITFAHRALEYSLGHTSMADKYLELLDLPAPQEQTCYEFDIRGLEKKMGSKAYDTSFRLFADRAVLFPDPIVEEQGRPFYKGQDYMIAAFFHSGVDLQDFATMLDGLVAIVEQDIERRKKVIKADPEVRSTREKVYKAFGKAVWSPKKRHSRGLSLGTSISS